MRSTKGSVQHLMLEHEIIPKDAKQNQDITKIRSHPATSDVSAIDLKSDWPDYPIMQSCVYRRCRFVVSVRWTGDVMEYSKAVVEPEKSPPLTSTLKRMVV